VSGQLRAVSLGDIEDATADHDWPRSETGLIAAVVEEREENINDYLAEHEERGGPGHREALQPFTDPIVLAEPALAGGKLRICDGHHRVQSLRNRADAIRAALRWNNILITAEILPASTDVLAEAMRRSMGGAQQPLKKGEKKAVIEKYARRITARGGELNRTHIAKELKVSRRYVIKVLDEDVNSSHPRKKEKKTASPLDKLVMDALEADKEYWGDKATNWALKRDIAGAIDRCEDAAKARAKVRRVFSVGLQATET